MARRQGDKSLLPEKKIMTHSTDTYMQYPGLSGLNKNNQSENLSQIFDNKNVI